MRYDYSCKNCQNEFEVIKPLRDLDNPETCSSCGSCETVRVVRRFHFYGANDWDKAEFNPAFGCIVRNNLHRKELAKRHGYEEIGNEPVENIHKHYEAQREAAREAAWDKV